MERSSGYACEPVSGGVKSKTTLLGRLFAHFALVYRGLQFALTRHALSMVSLTCFCTFLCSKGMFDIKFNTSMTILAAGTIFPLVFSVQAGFSRRDEALSSLAKLKGAMITIFLMFKTWEKDTDGRWMWEKQAQHQAPAHGVWATEVENAFDKLIDDIEIYLRGIRPAPEESSNVVYDGLMTLCDLMARFAPNSGHVDFAGQSGMGRMAAYHMSMISSFERLRVVLDTQLPVGLRLFCFSLIHVSPIVLAPYWTHFCSEKIAEFYNHDMSESPYGCPAGYFIAATYVLILVTLYRVQTQLENPFSGAADDDINWDLFRSHLDRLNTYGRDGPARRRALDELQHQEHRPTAATR